MLRPVKKALTFRASSIGDCLMGKYLLDQVHAQFPGAKLGIVVAGRAGMIRDLLGAYPHIEVLEVNRRSPGGLWRLWRQWRQSDLVVTQYAGKPGGAFSFMSKIVARILARRGSLVGFADSSFLNAYLYDHSVAAPHAHSPAEDERMALRAAGLGVQLPYPSLKNAHAGAPAKFNLAEGKYVLVHLFSGSTKRGLSPQKRQELVSALRELPYTLVLTGTTNERTEAIAAAGGSRVIAGEATLQETIDLVAHAAAVVSLDTGVAHIAAQLGKPVAVISTCMGLWWWNGEQYGPNASYKVFTNPLHTISEHRMVDYPACLNDTDFQDVAASVRSFLEKK